MASTTRLLGGLVLLVVALVSGAEPASSRPRDAVCGAEEMARALPEVRIRKLHLVRPDLIMYPLLHETYC